MFKSATASRAVKPGARLCENFHWVAVRACPGPKRWTSVLNNSVLNKTPRDCTAPYVTAMYSPIGHWIQYRPCYHPGQLPIAKMNRNERSVKLGQRVLESAVSQDGRDWIIAALDPFHDFQRQLAGFPDTDCVSTTVSEYQYEYDLSKPAGVVGNWDAHVFSTPLSMVTTVHSMRVVGNDSHLQNANKVLNDIGLLNVWAADTAQDLFQNPGAAFAPANASRYTFDTTNSLGSGSARLIAMGYEIVNTTADLTKQGALTAYRMPQPMDTTTNRTFVQAVTDPAVIGAPETIFQTTHIRRYVSLPKHAADAVLMKGARQWAAADGAYVVVPLANVHNPMSVPNRDPVQFSANIPAAAGEIIFGPSMTGMPNTPATIPATGVTEMPLYVNSTREVPFNSTGVFMTGLSPTSTFRIKLKIFVERAPSFNDPLLAPLASPSAPYDATVLALYSSCLASLPVAVPVCMNGFGDWFKEVLGIVGSVAAPVGALFGPQGAAIGAAVSTVANVAKTAFPDEVKPETKQAMFKMANEKDSKKNPGKKPASKVIMPSRRIAIPKSMRKRTLRVSR